MQNLRIRNLDRRFIQKSVKDLIDRHLQEKLNDAQTIEQTELFRSYITSQYNKTYVRIDDKNQPELYSPPGKSGVAQSPLSVKSSDMKIKSRSHTINSTQINNNHTAVTRQITQQMEADEAFNTLDEVFKRKRRPTQYRCPS